MKRKKKPFFLRLISFLLTIVIILGVAVGGAICYFRLPVSSYYNASEKAFIIPEIDEGYVPQGICYDRDKQTFLLSGYYTSDKASPVFLVDANGQLLKKVTLLNEDGTDFKGHSGGIAFWKDYIFVTGSKAILVYSYNELINNASSGDKLPLLNKISLKYSADDYVNTSFVCVYQGSLITGEFYREDNYPTLDSHKMITSCGDYNHAIAVEFELTNTGGNLGYELFGAYSIPDLVQGFEMDSEGEIFLSTSWGVAFSNIYKYESVDIKVRDEPLEILGKTVPVYELDSSCLAKTYKLPPMSEEMVFVDGKLLVTTESASNKYIFGKFTDSKYIYATDLSKM